LNGLPEWAVVCAVATAERLGLSDQRLIEVRDSSRTGSELEGQGAEVLQVVRAFALAVTESGDYDSAMNQFYPTEPVGEALKAILPLVQPLEV
jgi:hypothetical protein